MSRGDRDAVLTALERGVDVDVRDAYGQTPLMYAISTGQSTAFIEMLVRRGADVNARTEAGWTPMMYAARDLRDPQFTQVILLLYGAGADPTARNADGRLARHYLPADPSPPAEPAESNEPAPRPEAAASSEQPRSDEPDEPAEPGESTEPSGVPADAFETITGFLAREAGFDAECGRHDPSYAKQWCGYHAAPMSFDAFRRHWEAALAQVASAPRTRREWTLHRGVHVAFYDVSDGLLGVSFDASAGLVLLTLR